MSYQVLARKWRPKDFSQLMGQEHVVTVLVNALMQERLHHAYLFTGTRGVGKTTIARIFAKSLNCQQGITAEPCGKCDVCVDVDAGRFVDLLEIDAASRTKVDDTREILDNVQYAPSRGRFKVYLIDEVHMLSKSSFNALLKTLEEPPPHVKFILATTDPQKLPVTVLSRCLQFHLKALTPQQIETKLNEILIAEQVTFEDGALALLAKAARGSMRDSLSLTDQAIAQGQGHIEVGNVQQMLGGVDQNWVYKILIALIKQDAKGLLELSKNIASFAPSYHRLMAELLQLLHQVALWQLLPNSVDVDNQRATLLTKFAQAMSPEDVQLYYQIVLNGRKDLSYSADEQAGFDMVVLRMLAFKPATIADVQTSVAPTASSVAFADVELKDTIAAVASTLPKSADKEKVAAQVSVKTDEQSKQQFAEQPTQHSGVDVFSIDRNADKSLSDLNAEQDNLLAQAEQQFTQTAEDQFAQQDAEHEVELPVQPEPIVQAGPNVQAEQGSPQSDVEKMLATRNMLRSRKKASEGSAKKSEPEVKAKARTPLKKPAPHASINLQAKTDSKPVNQPSSITPDLSHQSATDPFANDESAEQAIERPSNQTPSSVAIEPSEQVAVAAEPQPSTTPEVTSATPAHAIDLTVNGAAFDQGLIDPSVTVDANQIDLWANTIDAMGLGGRVRQLALNATMDATSNDSLLVINLNRSVEHLNSAAAISQITECYSNLKQQAVEVQINTEDDVGATPFMIQNCINAKRLAYAKDVIANDDFVKALEQQFNAFVDENSIAPL
ncbi:hypothetical protein A9Q98_06120 [Thalassotalea sp. 42_200_T64]|nr:hypothetical protein A9Q98_06120 [Thalassotalea sp. 42_200_T64]